MQPIQGQFDELQDLIDEAKFIEEVYEVAFGDDAIHKDYSKQEVLETLRIFAEKAYMYDEEAKWVITMEHKIKND